MAMVSCGGYEPVLGRDKGLLKHRSTSAHARANTACRRVVSRKPLRSIEKTILAKFSAASPQAEAPVPSLLYWLMPSWETTCSAPSTMTLREIALISGSGDCLSGRVGCIILTRED